jgi:hypothetical protein
VQSLAGPLAWRNIAWVLKKSVLGMSFVVVMIAATELLFSPQLKGGFHSGCFRLAEEPHQSFDVLGHGC